MIATALAALPVMAPAQLVGGNVAGTVEVPSVDTGVATRIDTRDLEPGISASTRVRTDLRAGDARVRARARADAVGGPIAPPPSWSRSEADWESHYQRCQSLYRSYDPSTDTYSTYGGGRRTCRY